MGAWYGTGHQKRPPGIHRAISHDDLFDEMFKKRYWRIGFLRLYGRLPRVPEQVEAGGLYCKRK